MQNDDARTPCEYCGKMVGNGGRHMHVRSCLYRPGVIEAVRAVMDPDGAGVGMSSNNYDDARAECGASVPSSDALGRQCGEWADVLAFLGLERAPYTKKPKGAAGKRERRAIADAAEEMQRAREALRYDPGLPVCRVRELPDGRVAYMLR